MAEGATTLIVALTAIVVLLLMSRRANTRFRETDRLPMQWSIAGSVNWTAQRLIALAFTPVLATCVLFAAVVSTAILEPRQGQEGFELPVILALAVTFIVVHALHLKLIAWTFERADR